MKHCFSLSNIYIYIKLDAKQRHLVRLIIKKKKKNHISFLNSYPHTLFFVPIPSLSLDF